MANSDYVTNAIGYFTPYAATADSVAHLDTLIDITGFSTDRATNPQPGDMVIIGEEVLALVSFTTGQIEVKRGVADTLPAAHAADATVWFVEGRIGTDSREYAGNATLSVKVLPKTTSQSTPVAKSPPQQIALASRFARPYPPANLQVDGEPWFSAAPRLTAADPSVVITWAHRNRVTQSDQLIGHAEGSVSPEVGQTYRLRVFGGDGSLKATRDAGSATTFAYTRDDAVVDLGLGALSDTGDYSAHFLLEAVRDGYSSWQSYRINYSVDTAGLTVPTFTGMYWYDLVTGATTAVYANVQTLVPAGAGGLQVGALQSAQNGDGSLLVRAWHGDTSITSGPVFFNLEAPGSQASFTPPWDEPVQLQGSGPNIQGVLASGVDPSTGNRLVLSWDGVTPYMTDEPVIYETAIDSSGSVISHVDITNNNYTALWSLPNLLFKHGADWWAFVTTGGPDPQASKRNSGGVWSRLDGWFPYPPTGGGGLSMQVRGVGEVSSGSRLVIAAMRTDTGSLPQSYMLKIVYSDDGGATFTEGAFRSLNAIPELSVDHGQVNIISEGPNGLRRVGSGLAYYFAHEAGVFVLLSNSDATVWTFHKCTLDGLEIPAFSNGFYSPISTSSGSHVVAALKSTTWPYAPIGMAVSTNGFDFLTIPNEDLVVPGFEVSTDLPSIIGVQSSRVLIAQKIGESAVPSMSLTITDADDTLTAGMGVAHDLSLTLTDADDTLTASMAPAVVVAPTVDNLVFELLASKYTSGQTWANRVVAPHDGSAQTAYDFALGATASSESSDPTAISEAGFSSSDLSGFVVPADGAIHAVSAVQAESAIRGKFGVLTGERRYFEFHVTSSTAANMHVGIRTAAGALTSSGFNLWNGGGALYGSNNINGAGTSFTGNDIIMVAVDLSGATGKMWVGKNGVWISGGNPETGDAPNFYNFSTEEQRPVLWRSNNDALTYSASIQASEVDQTYDLPSGFSALSSAATHFNFDGGDYFTQIAAATAFTKAMHKAGSKFTIEVWCQIVDNGTNVAPFFDSGTSDQGGEDMSRGVIYGDIGSIFSTVTKHRFRVKRDASAASAVQVESDAEIARNSLQSIAVSFDGTGAQQSFLYKNGAYDPVGTNNTWDGTLVSPGTSDAVNPPRVGARGDGAFRLPSGTRIYGLRVYDTNLSKAQLDANYAAGVGVSALDGVITFESGSGVTLSNGGKTALSSSGWCVAPLALATPAAGLTYVELDTSAMTDKQMFGVYASSAVSAGNYLGGGGADGVSMGDDPRLTGSTFAWVDSTNWSSAGTSSIGIGVNQTTGKVNWWRNGSLQATEASFTPGTAGLHFAIGSNSARGPVTVKQASDATIPSGYTYLGA